MTSTRAARCRSNADSSGNDASSQKLRIIWTIRSSAAKATRRPTKLRSPLLELEIDERDFICCAIVHHQPGCRGICWPPDEERLFEEGVAQWAILPNHLADRNEGSSEKADRESFLPTNPIPRISDPSGK